MAVSPAAAERTVSRPGLEPPPNRRVEHRPAAPSRTPGVEKVDLLPGSGSVAVGTHGRYRQAIGILDLPLPDPLSPYVSALEAVVGAKHRHLGAESDHEMTVGRGRERVHGEREQIVGRGRAPCGQLDEAHGAFMADGR